MKQLNEVLKDQQEGAQKLFETQKSLTEEFSSQHLALGQKLAQDVQDVVKKAPADWQNLIGVCTDYQKQVWDLNTKAFQKGMQSWVNVASAFTPK